MNEKKHLIKAGIAKQSKSLTVISEDDKLFDIPDSWRWVKLGEISSVITKGTTPRGGNVSYLDSGIGFLRAENIAGLDKLDKTTLKYIDVETHNGYLKRSILEANDILITIAGTLGRTAIVHEEDLPLNANQAVSMVRIVDPNAMNLLYVVYILNSPEVQRYLTRQRKITAIPNLTLEIIENCLIPLPPLAEQKRIVAKIEELLPYIDRYEKAWSRLEDFNKRFPVDMQKSILQLAIQGKLVEQRPEEGTGEELYRQIQAEKRKLIEKGKIKKEKPLPEITEDEIPFDIPESWKWYRIGELFNVVNGFTPLKSNPEFWTDGDIPWFTIEDIHRQGHFILSTEKFITRNALSKNTERIVPPDTVLLCCTASVGEYAYTKISLTTNQQFNAFVVKEHYKEVVYPLYVFEYAKTLKGALIDRAGKTTFNFVSVGKLSNMLIPLPPPDEQKRIVSKLEEILPLCERLK